MPAYQGTLSRDEAWLAYTTVGDDGSREIPASGVEESDTARICVYNSQPSVRLCPSFSVPHPSLARRMGHPSLAAVFVPAPVEPSDVRNS